jgi:subtilisin family serine protease
MAKTRMDGPWFSVSLIFLTGALSPAGAATNLATNSERTAVAVPNEFIVGLKRHGIPAATSKALEAKLAHAFGLGAIRSLAPLQMDDTIRKLILKESVPADEALARLRGEEFASSIRFVEPNWIYQADGWKESDPFAGEPNDGEFLKQWDLWNIGQFDRLDAPDAQFGKPGSDINVLPLWSKGITGNRRLLVAVIDTGIDLNHPQLVPNLYRNPGEIPGNGIDDDRNGVIDDVQGANFELGFGTGNPDDDNNHGTHCAGTIGAVGNDRAGVSGVNWETSLLAVKFLSAKGSGTLEGSLNAVKYATKMGARVISNSWGGGSYSFALEEAIREAGEAGALFVAAAGNKAQNNDVFPHYPSSYRVDHIVSVAATTNRDELASFSNFGPETVDVAAPGKHILSTIRDGRYAYFSGTSMATPHVAGVAALIWSAHPNWTAAEVKSRLIRTSTRVYALREKVRSQGRINAYRAFHARRVKAPEADRAP